VTPGGRDQGPERRPTLKLGWVIFAAVLGVALIVSAFVVGLFAGSN